MNDLETKILNMMLDVNKDGVKERVKAVSQFFLEEIKEAYMKSYDDNIGDLSDGANELKSFVEYNFKNYLKSKYNISQ